MSASKITESELEIMKLLWASKEALPIASIRRALEESSEWNGSTIKTLLRRLCDKGVVSAEKRELFYYSPVVTESEYNDYTTQTIIDRLYQGSAKNLVASLVAGKKLQPKDIEDLRSMFKVGDGDE